MKLKIVTPIDSAPIAVASSLLPMRPAIAVETMPISGTVMFDMMFGIANRNIALFITCQNLLQSYENNCYDMHFLAYNLQKL